MNFPVHGNEFLKSIAVKDILSDRCVMPIFFLLCFMVTYPYKDAMT